MTKMGKTVCIDTNIFLWGLKRNYRTPNPPDLVERCDLLFKKLDKENCRIFVPAIAIGEAMVLMSGAEKISLFSSAAEKEIRIVSFDILAAKHFALLQAKNADIVKEMKANYTKRHISADLMIIASAMSIDADLIYSNDAGLGRLATGTIEVREVPPCDELNEPQKAFNFANIDV